MYLSFDWFCDNSKNIFKQPSTWSLGTNNVLWAERVENYKGKNTYFEEKEEFMYRQCNIPSKLQF